MVSMKRSTFHKLQPSNHENPSNNNEHSPRKHQASIDPTQIKLTRILLDHTEYPLDVVNHVRVISHS